MQQFEIAARSGPTELAQEVRGKSFGFERALSAGFGCVLLHQVGALGARAKIFSLSFVGVAC